MRRVSLAVIFWGSLWGLSEATIGFALHKAAIALPGLPGFLMFPIAFFFMRQAMTSTGSAAAIFEVSVVAALIKFVDFIVPGYDALRIVNPALSILLEGLACYAIILVVQKGNMKLGLPQAFAMGLAWRSLFAVHLWIISLFGLPAALVTSGFIPLFRFLIAESAANSLLIWTYLRLESKPLPAIPRFEIKPAACALLLISAFAAQLLL